MFDTQPQTEAPGVKEEPQEIKLGPYFHISGTANSLAKEEAGSPLPSPIHHLELVSSAGDSENQLAFGSHAVVPQSKPAFAL